MTIPKIESRADAQRTLDQLRSSFRNYRDKIEPFYPGIAACKFTVEQVGIAEQKIFDVFLQIHAATEQIENALEQLDDPKDFQFLNWHIREKYLLISAQFLKHISEFYPSKQQEYAAKFRLASIHKDLPLKTLLTAINIPFEQIDSKANVETLLAQLESSLPIYQNITEAFCQSVRALRFTVGQLNIVEQKIFDVFKETYNTTRQIENFLEQSNIDNAQHLDFSAFSLRGKYRTLSARLLRQILTSYSSQQKKYENRLRSSCKNGDIASTTLLIESGTDINCRDKKRYTPLHYAALLGNPHLANLLIDAGAEVNIVGLDKTTPLHAACYRGDPATVDVLLRRGAIVKVVDKRGRTPLLCACSHGNRDIVLMLLKRNPDLVTRCNRSGKTPLHKAANRKDADFTEDLIQAGGSLGAIDSSARTPIAIAALNGNQDRFNTLKQKYPQASDELIIPS